MISLSRLNVSFLLLGATALSAAFTAQAQDTSTAGTPPTTTPSSSPPSFTPSLPPSGVPEAAPTGLPRIATDDTDSYTFFGTNNAFDPYVTVGNYAPPQSGHVNWGHIMFDVTGVSLMGPKYLALTSDAYVVAADEGSIMVLEDGAATIEIVALQAPFGSYLAAGSEGLGWFIGNVVTPDAVGTAFFANDTTVYIDVTETVNAWIAGAPNFGFALRGASIGPGVELISTTGRGPAPMLTHGIPSGPVMDYFPGAFNDASGLRYYAGWFGSGWFFAHDFPWIFHDDHGWLLLSGEGGDAVLFYDTALRSWVWTFPALDNYYYLSSEQFGSGWLYHLPGTGVGTGDNRWFYDFGGGLWITVPAGR